jgi:hypothetical protein
MINQLYYHPEMNQYMRLVKNRPSGVNTFLEVDKYNLPIEKKRNWAIHPTFQYYAIFGFENLTIT